MPLNYSTIISKNTIKYWFTRKNHYDNKFEITKCKFCQSFLTNLFQFVITNQNYQNVKIAFTHHNSEKVRKVDFIIC